jgi:hypothetical protein
LCYRLGAAVNPCCMWLKSVYAVLPKTNHYFFQPMESRASARIFQEEGAEG